MNPSFKYKMFDRFLGIFNEEGNILMQMLDKAFPTGKEKHSLHYFMERCTLDVAFGIQNMYS
jgi:hypothetical protein